ncbi:hypothetical protein ASPWEDRAFT_71286 [Aspergillus wentii DTO 134E9]|uniref:Uncharacterized protein n=1 Tax=Aspergillus wentii DTO 134E9 TaxID=1073089 RepID=A0A1L9RAH4_ASPWE|nr:uncharacterized protein ASPWEDRAFT_71286 [Aspergillus wentii DTO 134E9]KAI9934499.1 hypothetical protein MW887_000113 [Aspergillus wentii]OJJ31910.1 hypothetical protein ASPWEDRAFT_71286 [Aspergillus wentii DTO 134E9]
MSFFTLLASGAIEAKERELGHEIDVVREPVLCMEILANSYLKSPLSKALADILKVTRGATSTFTNTCPRGEVHTRFLTELSQDFSFEKDAMKYLDRMLTQFVDFPQRRQGRY